METSVDTLLDSQDEVEGVEGWLKGTLTELQFERGIENVRMRRF